MTDIVRMRGDTYSDEWTLKDKSTGAPLPIAGYTFLMTVSSKKDPKPADAFEYQVIGIILDPNAGRVEFVPTLNDVNRIGTYYYDIQMIDTIGRKRTIVKATYMFTQDLTKD